MFISDANWFYAVAGYFKFVPLRGFSIIFFRNKTHHASNEKCIPTSIQSSVLGASTPGLAVAECALTCGTFITITHRMYRLYVSMWSAKCEHKLSYKTLMILAIFHSLEYKNSVFCSSVPSTLLCCLISFLHILLLFIFSFHFYTFVVYFSLIPAQRIVFVFIIARPFILLQHTYAGNDDGQDLILTGPRTLHVRVSLHWECTYRALWHWPHKNWMKRLWLWRHLVSSSCLQCSKSPMRTTWTISVYELFIIYWIM